MPRQSGPRASADFAKFVNHRCDFSHELRKIIGTSNFMILVPLFYLGRA